MFPGDTIDVSVNVQITLIIYDIPHALYFMGSIFSTKKIKRGYGSENLIKNDKKGIEDDENLMEDNENHMEDDKNQANGVEIGDKCSYSGVLSATEELVRYDVSVLYCVGRPESPVKITEIDGFYNEDRCVQINYYRFQNYVLHRASNLLYSVVHKFNDPLRKIIQRAGLLEDSQEVDDIWI